MAVPWSGDSGMAQTFSWQTAVSVQDPSSEQVRTEAPFNW